MIQFIRKTCHTTLWHVLVSRAIYKQSTINGYRARGPRRPARAPHRPNSTQCLVWWRSTVYLLSACHSTHLFYILTVSRFNLTSYTPFDKVALIISISMEFESYYKKYNVTSNVKMIAEIKIYHYRQRNLCHRKLHQRKIPLHVCNLLAALHVTCDQPIGIAQGATFSEPPRVEWWTRWIILRRPRAGAQSLTQPRARSMPEPRATPSASKGSVRSVPPMSQRNYFITTPTFLPNTDVCPAAVCSCNMKRFQTVI